jgi:hypothetical protein
MELSGLIVFLSGLAVFAWLGYYNRYWADDWCYNADFLRLGFWGTLKGYTHITTYASNRFSLTVFSGLFYQGGVFGVQIMTGLFISFWVSGLYRLLTNVGAMLFPGTSRMTGLLVATLIVYHSIYLAPHPYQSIYWRSGLLPYTAPLIFGIWVFVSITSRARHPARGRGLAVLAGVLSFFAGGFSEAGNATLITMLVAYVFACLLLRRMKWARDTFPIAFIALLASVSAMAVMIASPTTDYRLGLYEAPVSIAEYPRSLLYNTFEFLALNILGAPSTHLSIFGALLFVGALSAPQAEKQPGTRTSFIPVFAIAAITFVVIAAGFAPSVYIEKSLPALRARIIAQFTLILGYGLIAFILGYHLRQRIRWQYTNLVINIVLVLLYAHGVQSIIPNIGKIPLYAERAAVWDQRDLQIRQSKDQGILEIHVRGIDGLPVGGIRDFADSYGPGYWVNNCAIRYYGVEAIYATLP